MDGPPNRRRTPFGGGSIYVPLAAAEPPSAAVQFQDSLPLEGGGWGGGDRAVRALFAELTLPPWEQLAFCDVQRIRRTDISRVVT